MAARGWIGLTWPTSYGGGGRSYVDRLSMTELLLAAGAPLAAHWFADRQMGPSILAHGTDAQKKRYLPEILAGEVTYCIGMSEPDAGSDLAGVRTRAVRTGAGWRITGHKVWTSLAQHSDYIYLLARTDPSSERHAGLSELIVPLRSEGITISPIHDMSGAHHFNEVFFDDVEVDGDALIGTEGRRVAPDHRPARLRARRAGTDHEHLGPVRGDAGGGRRRRAAPGGAGRSGGGGPGGPAAGVPGRGGGRLRPPARPRSGHGQGVRHRYRAADGRTGVAVGGTGGAHRPARSAATCCRPG